MERDIKMSEASIAIATKINSRGSTRINLIWN